MALLNTTSINGGRLVFYRLSLRSEANRPGARSRRSHAWSGSRVSAAPGGTGRAWRRFFRLFPHHEVSVDQTCLIPADARLAGGRYLAWSVIAAGSNTTMSSSRPGCIGPCRASQAPGPASAGRLQCCHRPVPLPGRRASSLLRRRSARGTCPRAGCDRGRGAGHGPRPAGRPGERSRSAAWRLSATTAPGRSRPSIIAGRRDVLV